MPRFEAPFGYRLLLGGFFQALEERAAHPFVKLAASDANVAFLVLFFLFPLTLDLDHLRTNRVILPLEVVLKRLIAPLPLLLLLPDELNIAPLLPCPGTGLLMHCVSEVAGGPEKEWFFLCLVVVLGEGEGKSDDAEYILGLEHDQGNTYNLEDLLFSIIPKNEVFGFAWQQISSLGGSCGISGFRQGSPSKYIEK